MGGSSSKEAKVVQESARAVLARRNIQPSPPPPSYGAPDLVSQSSPSSRIPNSVPPSPSATSTTSTPNLPNQEAKVQSTSQSNEQVGFEMKKDILAEISKWQVKSETTVSGLSSKLLRAEVYLFIY